MAVFDDMMATGGAGLLMQVHGAAQPAIYKPPSGEQFEWSVIVGQQRGGEVYDSITGDTMKAIRLAVTGPAATLIAKGIATIQRQAKVVIDGKNWEIEVAASQFGPALVRLGLILKFTKSHEDMTSRGSV